MKKLFAILLVLLIPTFCFAGGNNNENNSGGDQDQSQQQQQQQQQYQNQNNNQSNKQNNNQTVTVLPPVNNNKQYNNQNVSVGDAILTANPTINVTTGQPVPVVPVTVEGTTLSVQQPNQDVSTIVETPSSDLGLNRQFVQPYNQSFPNTIQYNGPFDPTGWNMFSDLGLLPNNITKIQAESLSKMDSVKVNGIKDRVSLLIKQRYEYEKYAIVGKPAGKFIGIAYIKDADFTSKGVAVAGLVAMSKGANRIMLIAVYQYTPKSTTVGLGGGGDVAALRGDKMQNSLNGGTAIGYAHSWGTVEVVQGLVVLMYEE